MTKFRHAIGGNVVAFCSPYKILYKCPIYKFETALSHRVNQAGL